MWSQFGANRIASQAKAETNGYSHHWIFQTEALKAEPAYSQIPGLPSMATGVEKGRKFNCCSVNVPSDSDSSHMSVLMTLRGL